MAVTESIDSLAGSSIDQVYPVFMEAFSDYVQDASKITQQSFRNRMIKNGVDLAQSAGLFSDGRLVGFTLVGIDSFEGDLCAYDAGTGLVKAQRGKGLARAMFDFLAPRLKRIGIVRFILEGLKENEPAIKVYRKAGFQVRRELDSNKLVFADARLDEPVDEKIGITPISMDDLLSYERFLDWQPSWENSLRGIQRIPNELLCVTAIVEQTRAGILVFNPMNKWLMCQAVKQEFRQRKIATHLLQYLREQIWDQVPSVQLVNVQNDDPTMKKFLESVGCQYLFSQYEMGLDL